MRQRIKPRIQLALVIICALITYICMNWGCTGVRKSRNRAFLDSVARLRTFTGTETFSREKSFVPVTFNPGDFAGIFNLRSYNNQVFETDGYRIEVKADSSGSGKLQVKGKDKTVPAPVDKSTFIRSGSATDQQVTLVKKTEQETKVRDGWWNQPWPYFLLILLVSVLAVVPGLIKNRLSK